MPRVIKASEGIDNSRNTMGSNGLNSLHLNLIVSIWIEVSMDPLYYIVFLINVQLSWKLFSWIIGLCPYKENVVI